MAKVFYFGPVRNLCTTGLGFLCTLALHGQTVLINELQAAGVPGDRVEIFNASDRTVDLEGYGLFLRGAHHRIPASLIIPAHGYGLLWFDRDPDAGPDHIGLKLPREGSTLLLVAPDRSTVLDAFTYPSLPDGVSMGRTTDGGRQVGYFASPTFGTSNHGSIGVHHLLAPPDIEVVFSDAVRSTIKLSAGKGASICYALGGDPPDPRTATVYDGIFTVEHGCVITALAFADDAVPSAPSCCTIIAAGQAGVGCVSLVMDPFDLTDPTTGINVEGSHGNYAQRGDDWKRKGFVQFPGDAPATPVMIGIAGSGSRSFPKRSFKISGMHGRELPFDTVDRDTYARYAWTMRADASPHAFLRNLFIEQVALACGAYVDVQPSLPVHLRLNGRDHGLYRLMPAKGAAWVRSFSGAEAIDLLEGPAADVVAGDRDHFDLSLQALLRRAPSDTLDALMDLHSLIDLACFDLYTGRADHDLNVRCWRPKVDGGRWRWILYDMDLWAPAEENSVERFCASDLPETPYVPQLLAHPQLRERLLARMVALLHSTLSPGRAATLVNDLYNVHEPLLRDDHERWSGEMAMPTPAECRDLLNDFVRHRPDLLLEHMGGQLGRPLRTFDVNVVPAQAGMIFLEELAITDDRSRITGFAQCPLRFTVTAAEGMEFTGWKGHPEDGPAITIDPARVRVLQAMFRPAGTSRRHGLEQTGE